MENKRLEQIKAQLEPCPFDNTAVELISEYCVETGTSKLFIRCPECGCMSAHLDTTLDTTTPGDVEQVNNIMESIHNLVARWNTRYDATNDQFVTRAEQIQ